MTKTKARRGKVELESLEPFGRPLHLVAKSLPRICIVSSELVGPFKNGGIGTSMTGLAELLGAYGGDVTIMYTGEVNNRGKAEWTASYFNIGIKLKFIDDFRARSQIGLVTRNSGSKAWQLLEYFKDQSFDVIHFNDTLGEGVFCFVAKRLGMMFDKTLMVLALHSPVEWILDVNKYDKRWLGYVQYCTAERLALANADVVWGPSKYLLDWVKEKGYLLPQRQILQHYVIPTTKLFEPGSEKCANAALPIVRGKDRVPAEIVFFGRLEERKGLRLFLAAITRLSPELTKRGIRVLFMGKISGVGEVQADEYINSRSKNWKFEWRMEPGFGQQEALAYLTGQNCLAVMPSPADNSPCTIYEALQNGVPFIAAATGGIPELVNQSDAKRVLFEYRVDSICKCIMQALDKGAIVPRPSTAVLDNQKNWLGFHANYSSYLPPKKVDAKVLRYAVVVDHDGSEKALVLTLASLESTFGKNLCHISIHNRNLLPVSEATLKKADLILDEVTDLKPKEIAKRWVDKKIDAVVFMRSGVECAAVTCSIFNRVFSTGFDGAVPFAAVNDNTVMPTFAAGAALAFLEGEFDTGGCVFSLAKINEVLERDPELMGVDRLYMGVLEVFQALSYNIVPIPEPLFVFKENVSEIVKWSDVSRRNRVFALSRPMELDYALSAAKPCYGYIYPMQKTTDISATAQLVKQAAPIKTIFRLLPRNTVIDFKRLFGIQK